MSTRGLLGFVHKGHVRASFNHFDSYLEGLGQSVVSICKIMVDWETFTSRYEKIKWISALEQPLKYLSGKEILMEILKDNTFLRRMSGKKETGVILGGCWSTMTQ